MSANVQIAGRSVAVIDRSGSIAVGGAAQNLSQANPGRTALFVQNTSSGNLRVSSRGIASATAGIMLAPGALYEWPANMIPIGAVSIWGATAGQTFEAGEV